MIDDRIETFIKKVFLIFGLDKLEGIAERLVRKNYNKGFDDLEATLQSSINFVPNERAIHFLKEYSFQNIKGMRDDFVVKLRQQLVEAFINREGSRQIAKRVSRVMDITRARAETIARTESHRAYNVGAMDVAQQSGLKLKKVVYNPSPKTDICKALVNMEPIPINDKFKYGKESWLIPPFHPNCRSRVLYIQEGKS